MKIATVAALVVVCLSVIPSAHAQSTSPQRDADAQDSAASGQAPPEPDTRGSTTTISLEDEFLAALPTTGNYNSILALISGIVTDSAATPFDALATSFTVHGGRLDDGRLLVDGLPVISPMHGGAPGTYLANIADARQVTVTTSGGLGDRETGGPYVNLVPRAAANRVQGRLFAAGNSEGMQGSNFGPEQQQAGAVRPFALTSAWDIGGSVNGAIVRNRLWYFTAGRSEHATRRILGLYENTNAFNPGRFLYAPNFDRPAFSDRAWENGAVRMTAATGRDGRVSAMHDEQAICRRCTGATGANGLPDLTAAPEAQGVGDVGPQRFDQASWRASLTPRVHVDAGVSRFATHWGNSEREGNQRSLVRAVDSAFGLFYRSQDWAENDAVTTTWRGAVGWMLGAHHVTVGYEGLKGSDDRTSFTNDQALTYRLNNGVPTQVTETISPFTVRARIAETSAFLQDDWTLGRLTAHGAVRFDRARSWFPEQRVDAGRFLAQPLLFPETRGVDAYRDFTPRAGVALDATGDGRTVIRVSAGKYLEGVSTAGIYYDANPMLRVVRSTSRTWFDVNGNYVVDCDLSIRAATGAPDLCGAISNTLFGQVGAGSRFDASVLSGSGVRPSDWQAGATVEREVTTGVRARVGYYRRWFAGMTVVDNVAATPSDYVPFSVDVPASLTIAGGPRTITGFYALNPAAFSRFDLVTRRASDYGDVQQYADTVDALIDGRTPFGLRLLAGTSTSRSASNTCEVRALVPEIAPLDPFCDRSTGFLTQVKALATYVIEPLDVQVGAVYRNDPGPALAATVTAFFFTPFFGSAQVNPIEPGSAYGDRIQQLDVRVVKRFRVGRFRTSAGIDLFNAFNSASPLTYSTGQVFSSGPTPRTLLAPRLLRVLGEVRF